MAGWEIRRGDLVSDYCSEEEYWRLFNFVFSSRSMKRNTYKFGLIKAILDNLLNAVQIDNGFSIEYYDLFYKFVQCYWNLVLKYNIKQMRNDHQSTYSKVETILYECEAANTSSISISQLEFTSLKLEDQEKIVKKVIKECKKYVLGALYEDLEGKVYGFDKKNNKLIISFGAYDFLLKFKANLEKLNYYCWAQFL